MNVRGWRTGVKLRPSSWRDLLLFKTSVSHGSLPGIKGQSPIHPTDTILLKPRDAMLPVAFIPYVLHGFFQDRLHTIHMLAAALVHLDGPTARAIYDKLRTIYNPVRLASALPIPLFEEWQGVSAYCSEVYCR